MAVSLKLPLVLVDDADLVRVSAENPGYQFEREEDGTLTVSPTFTNGGARSGEAYFQLRLYANSAGGRAFDSNTGFAIGPHRAIKSPDAAWVSRARIDSLNETELAGFWPLSPDVAIEVASASDDFDDTVSKIEFYLKHGTAYGVAIDPRTRRVVERGEALEGLSLDFDAIVDA
jgi:Uma2 family endonuclease